MNGTSPLEERISIYLFGRSRVGAAIPKVVTVPQVGGQTYFCCLSAGKYSGTSLHTPRQMLQVLYRWTNFFPKQQRHLAAAGCARQCPSGGRAGSQYRQSIGRSALPLTRRTTSAASAANECEGITCLRQVTRNGSDEAERSERSLPGVARNAGDEGLAAAGGQVSGEAAPASGSALQPDRPPPPARGSGGRARRPPEPSAGRRPGAHYPPGSSPVLALKNCYPPGSLPVFAAMQSRI